EVLIPTPLNSNLEVTGGVQHIASVFETKPTIEVLIPTHLNSNLEMTGGVQNLTTFTYIENPNISDLLKLEFADLYIVNKSVPSGLEFRYVSGFDFMSSPLGKFNAETRLNIVKPIITEEFVQTLDSLKNIV